MSRAVLEQVDEPPHRGGTRRREVRSGPRRARTRLNSPLDSHASGRSPMGLGVGDAVIAPVRCRALGEVRARWPVRARARVRVESLARIRRRSRTDVPRAGARAARGGRRLHSHERPRAPAAALEASRTGGARVDDVRASLARATWSGRAGRSRWRGPARCCARAGGRAAPADRQLRPAGAYSARSSSTLGGEVEAVAVAAAAEGDVGPFAVDAVGGEDVGVVDGEALGDVAGDGVAVHERRVAGGGRLGEVVPVEPDPPSAQRRSRARRASGRRGSRGRGRRC